MSGLSIVPLRKRANYPTSRTGSGQDRAFRLVPLGDRRGIRSFSVTRIQ